MQNITSIEIILSLLILIAFFIVTAKRITTACWLLIVMIVTTAFLWFLFSAEFLSYSLVLVYVGAVMTLFLFTVNLLQIKSNNINKNYVLILSTIFAILLYPNVSKKSVLNFKNSFNLEQIALKLYEDFGLGFVCIGLILLVSIVCAITMLKQNQLIKDNKQVMQPGKIRWDDES